MGYLRLRDVGKAYRRYHGKWSRLAEWLDPDQKPRHEAHWVLRDVSLEVSPGESVGVLGHNGAGKSTLLKIITGTTRATSGSVEVGGRVAALLELGMGFHPDFTGRQNALMSAQLMGLSADEIARAMPAIEDFAEIGEYIDQSVRTYSSGMQMRLAFAVATCARPDILIVDEALAVGDIYFQQKCFDRIGSFVRDGTTLLFVSHAMGTVLNLCTRALLLDHGRVKFDGDPKHAVDLYQADLLIRLDRAPSALSVASPAEASLAAPVAPGSLSTASAALESARLLDGSGRETTVFETGANATIEFSFRTDASVEDPHAGFKIRNVFGQVLYETNSYCLGARETAPAPAGRHRYRFTFPMRLAPGQYTVTAGFASGGYGEGSFREVLSYLHDVLAFEVVRNTGRALWSGLVDLEPVLSVERGG